jgi:hypothetical protein
MTSGALVLREARGNTPNICSFGGGYALGLADDRKFVTRVLLLFSGSLLKFLGNCLRGAMQLYSV